MTPLNSLLWDKRKSRGARGWQAILPKSSRQITHLAVPAPSPASCEESPSVLEEARRGGSVYYTYHIYLIVAVSAPLLPRRCSQPCSPGATSRVVHLLTSPICWEFISQRCCGVAQTRSAVPCPAVERQQKAPTCAVRAGRHGEGRELCWAAGKCSWAEERN